MSIIFKVLVGFEQSASGFSFEQCVRAIVFEQSGNVIRWIIISKDMSMTKKNADLVGTLMKVQTLAKIPSPGLNWACGKWQIIGPNYLMIKSP